MAKAKVKDIAHPSDTMVRNPRRMFHDTYTGAVLITRDDWKSVPFESLLEQDWLVQTDAFDYSLTSILAQPMNIEYRFDGKKRIWIPDFLLQRKESRPALVEVKTLQTIYPEDEEKQDYVAAKFDARRTAALAKGYDFVLATENEIRVQPRLTNANLMRRSADRHYPEAWERMGLAVAASLPAESSVRDLQEALGSTIDAFSVALRLAWRGVIRLDPSQVWTRNTSFGRTDQPIWRTKQ